MMSSIPPKAAIFQHTTVWMIAVLTLSFATLAAAAHDARADPSATGIVAQLPTARYAASAVWDGTNAYIFGGIANGSGLDEIVRYNPATSTVTVMNAKLPTPRHYTSAIWDGDSAYIFGGHAPSPLNEIVRYTPSTDTVATLSVTLPTARWMTSAAWDGSNAYIFGGSTSGGQLDEIVRFNPGTNAVTPMPTKLPSKRTFTSAVWGGDAAYVFGGYSGNDGRIDEILRYNPATHDLSTMGAHLPTGRSHTSAAWDGKNAYIFGGALDGEILGEILSYNPSTNLVLTVEASLPTPRVYTNAISDGNNTFVFGGVLDGTPLNEIVRVNLTPRAPVNLSATPGPNAQQITLRWQAPPTNGGLPVTNYTIYRGNASGDESLITQIGNIHTYTDSDLSDGVRRFYRVSAQTAAGNSPLSNEVNATTFTPPTPPQDLTATPGPNAREVTLTWQAPTNNGGLSITNYTIHRGNSSGTETFLTQIGNQLTFTDRACPILCFYKVRASNAAGDSADSDEAFAPIMPPSEIHVQEQNASRSLDPQSSPSASSQNATTPPVETPACTVEVCTSPTPIPEHTVTTPRVSPIIVDTPPIPIPEQCVPLILCAGPVTIPEQSIGLTPEIPSTTIQTPSQSIPAACGVADGVCPPQTTIAPSETVSSPPISSMDLTPGVNLSVSTSGFGLILTSHAGEVGSNGPFPMEVPTPFGAIPVIICPSTCPTPVLPEMMMSGGVTVTATVGPAAVSQTVPLNPRPY